MITRTIAIQNPCHLKSSNQQLVISYKHIPAYHDMPDKTIPLEDIGLLLLEHPHITLSHHLLSQCNHYNVALVSCNAQHHPTGIMLSLDGHTLQSARYQHQINATQPLKKQLWQQTIIQKIQNQSAHLQQRNIPHLLLSNLALQTKSGDTTNTEAQAAHHYWQHLFAHHPQLQNTFTRHRHGSYPNPILNYGYAILRATTARALVGSGLLPTLGIHHRNQYNAYCLADDIMEPYRPYIDQWALQIIDPHGIQAPELTQAQKAHLLHIPALDVHLDGQTRPLTNALQHTTASLAKCYASTTRKIQYPQLPTSTQ